jgi:hypothetical protein
MICLVQLLCPARHAVLAAAFDMADRTESDAIAGLKEVAKQIGLNPWCGICGSTVLTYETKKTGFKTMSDALPFIYAIEQANLTTRALLDTVGATFDIQRKN